MADSPPTEQERAIEFVRNYFCCSYAHASSDTEPFRVLRNLHARAIAEQRERFLPLIEAASDLHVAADKAAMAINRHDDGEDAHDELMQAHDACLAAMTPMALALHVIRGGA